MKRIKASTFTEAMSGVDEKYVDEAIRYKGIKLNTKFKTRAITGAVAACLCLAVLGAVLLTAPRDKALGGNGSAASQPAFISGSDITIPVPEIYLGSDTTADMTAFFLYDGRMYTQIPFNSFKAGAELIGEYVNTATGLIDEWTKEDGYVDLAGSISGDFYTVKGYDPEFMLCMKFEYECDDDGKTDKWEQLGLFVANGGITLDKGADIFEDRLHLAGNYTEIKSETRDSWYYSKGETEIVPSESYDVVDRFIEALNTAEVMPFNSIPHSENSSPYDDKEIYHLFFRKTDGIEVWLRLFDGGYVIYPGINSVCVKVPDDVFAQLIDLID